MYLLQKIKTDTQQLEHKKFLINYDEILEDKKKYFKLEDEK